MTYEKWLEEMNKGRRTQLQEQKKLIMDAAAKCSKETRRDLAPFLKNLDALFAGPAGKPDISTMGLLFDDEVDDREPVSEPEYTRITESLGTELSGLVRNFQVPDDLLSQPGVADSLISIFDAIGKGETKYAMPEFKPLTQLPFEVMNNYETYCAQMVAMDGMGAEATPREFIKAAASISGIRKDAAFKKAVADTDLRVAVYTDPDRSLFLKGLEKKRDEFEWDRDASSFKELSDEFAKDYRAGKLKYAELETRMNILRAVAHDKEPDPGEWDDVIIHPEEVVKKVQELREAQARSAQSDQTPQEYQDELADSMVMDHERKSKCVHEIYNAKPVFREEFALDESRFVLESYRKTDFDANMHEIDISGYSFGQKPLTDDEFGSLSFLSVIDPKLAGSYLSIDGRTVEYKNSDMATTIAMLTTCTIGYGDKEKLINGERVFGPAERVGSTMRLAVAPARDKTEEALKAWNAGDRKPLGEIIAAGLDHVLNDLEHVDKDGMFLNPDCFAYSDMAKEAIGLLRRDHKLMEAAKGAGLKEETLMELEGIMMCTRIEKAGAAAKKRLFEAGSGISSLSPFEREQCTLAVQRYDCMLKTISEASKAFDTSPEFEKLTEEYYSGMDSMDKKYGENSEKRRSIEAKIEAITLFHKYTLGQTHAKKRPELFMTLAEEGVAGLDKMLPQDRLDPKAAASMSSVELAQKLGIVKPRKIETTAKDVYDQLTKEYKSGMINYTLYAARLKIMRELTGGNRNAKIDIQTLDTAIDGRLKKSIGPLETTIEAFMSKTFEGNMGRRLNNIYNTYGNEPKADQVALDHPSYTMDEFSVLQNYPGSYEVGKLSIRMKEFAALSVAATQAYPEIGGVCLVKTKQGDLVNAIKNPTIDDAASLRALYVSDIDQGTNNHAREGIGIYFKAVMQPARDKVNEVLKAYKNGKGDADELGKLIGLGIKNIVNNTLVVDKGSSSFNISSVIEGHLAGQLAVVAAADPKLKGAVLRYAKPEDLDKAKGMGVLYGIVRGAEEAKQRLEASSKGEVTLSANERKACVELLLRQKILHDIAGEHAKKRFTDDMETKHLEEENRLAGSTSAENAVASTMLEAKIPKTIGLPDYVKMLGKLGPRFARDLLDEKMPNRDAFMELDDKAILKALDARAGSKDDPFMNKEYTKEKYNANNQLERSLREAKIREAAPQQKKL